MAESFDPTKYIMKIKGKDYLETKWRLVWLRDVHPNASVETELVRADDQGVTIRADVSWPIIMHEADQSPLHIVHNTGYAMELWDKPGRIGAALENAETSAIGRALAAAGFGTQFAPELDFDSSGDRVADSPVRRDDRKYPVQPQQTQPDAPSEPQPSTDGILATEKQIKYLYWKASECGWSKDEVVEYLKSTFHVGSSSELTKAQISTAIDHVQGIPAETTGGVS